MNAKEIIDLIIENINSPYEVEDGLDEDIFGKTEIVDDYESTDGSAHRVYYFKEHNVYIRHNGYYNSYENYAEYDEHDYSDVTPYTQLVTFYESSNERLERLETLNKKNKGL